MAHATLRQINDRLLVIDDLLFKMATGQVPATAEEYDQLSSEGEELMEVLAKGISENGPHDYKYAWNARNEVREMNRLSAMVSRHVELHPNGDPESDRLVEAAFADGATAEDLGRLAEGYAYMFVELPRASAAAVPTPKKGLLQRLFRA